jgi:steroid 5-alpha reductase family enzyme
MFIILLPVMLSNIELEERKSLLGIPVVILYLAGLGLWLIGFFFQSISDYQLLKFKRNHLNKGKVMRYGLWKYSRHPNYFGEATMWWGVFMLSLISCFSLGDAMLRLLGPITITFLLLKVSGVVMLEKKYSGNPEYEDYQKKTSSFLPWPPRKEDKL